MAEMVSDHISQLDLAARVVRRPRPRGARLLEIFPRPTRLAATSFSGRRYHPDPEEHGVSQALILEGKR